jgi:cytochrome bd-type quinol oxidase subunit 1
MAHLVVSQGRVPTRVQGVPDQATATPAEPQTHIVFTLTTGVIIVVIAFLFGLWFSWMWRRRHGTR